MPLRAFIDSYNEGQAARHVVHLWPWILMPLRAFIDSYVPSTRKDGVYAYSILMPLRAFIDSYVAPKTRTRRSCCILMPLRAFIDSYSTLSHRELNTFFLSVSPQLWAYRPTTT